MEATSGITFGGSSSSLFSNRMQEKVLMDVFKNLGGTSIDGVPLSSLLNAMLTKGICPVEDQRLIPVRKAVAAEFPGCKLPDVILDFSQFFTVCKPAMTLMTKVLTNDLAVKDWTSLHRTLYLYHEALATVQEGTVAEGLLTPPQWALAITSIDGQQLDLGPSRTRFTMGELSHLVLYALSVEWFGVKTAHEFVALGRSVKDSPLSEWGALVEAALLQAGALAKVPPASQHRLLESIVSALAGGATLSFDSPSYIERLTSSELLKSFLADLVARKMAPPCLDVDSTLRFYQEACCLQLNVKELSVLAATLANNGQCPVTDKQVLSATTATRLLSCMSVCGEKETILWSGAKSGGALLVLPGLLGLAMYSPLMDPDGVSHRARLLIKKLYKHYRLHPYEIIPKRAPTRYLNIKGEEGDLQKGSENNLWDPALMETARRGDTLELASLALSGRPLNAIDYMGRTVLHLAAAMGHMPYIKLLLKMCPELVKVRDLSGWTAQRHAEHFHKDEIASLLKDWDVLSGSVNTGISFYSM